MDSGVLRAVSGTPWQRAISRWERFWFADVPSDVFAVIRIAIGAGGLISLIGFLPIDMFWSPDGIAPLPGGGIGIRSYLVESGLGVAAGTLIFAVLFVAFTCMTLGLFTGAAVVVCFFGSVFQARWNSLPLTSGHTILVAVLFCLLWADCSSWPSIDAWRKRQCALPTAPPVQPVWPLRLMRIQMAVMYLTSGLFKLIGPGWRSGSTVYYATTQNIYGRVLHVYPLPQGIDWILTALSYATVLWEITFPLMMLHRVTRTAAILIGIGTHLGIGATMEVGPFSLMMLLCYSAFISPDQARRVVGWLSQRRLTSHTPADTRAPAAEPTSAA